MNNRRLSFGYEDTDKSIEVELYGLIFEINKEKIVNKNIREINDNDEEEIRNEIEDLIGIGSIDRINKKRVADGYAKMTLDVEIAVLTCIYKAYIDATAGEFINGIEETSNEVIEKTSNYRNFNRYQRRNYNRGRRKYRRY